jgi:transcriptional regulator with XRE-family HTH domain
VARASARTNANALTVHQVVAYNVFRARTLRGWTQQRAAEAIGATLGKPLTAAGLSAIEKTFSSRRQRVIDVAELVAFARAFGLPIAWFFLPPEGRETHPIPPTYKHAATMAVDAFGDEDAWQWYLARIVALLGAPRSILHDELLGSAGYPSADEWEAIDRKREELLDTALRQFSSEHRDLLDALVADLTALRQKASADARQRRRQLPDDAFGRLNDRLSVERVQRADGIHIGEPPELSPRYQPTRGT